MNLIPDELRKAYPVLDELPEVPLARLGGSLLATTLPARTLVFTEHQPCSGFPFVLTGSIRVVKSAPNGRELPLYRVLPGDTCFITASCLIGHKDYNARGETESETRLLLLARPAFEDLLEHAPFRRFVFLRFAERITDLMHLVEEVAFQRLDQRLASRLLGHGREIRVTHQQLALELGSVREIISRILKGFEHRGLVKLGRESVEILDPAGLRSISDVV